MKYVFDAGGRAELARLARSNTLVAFDFDGTLAPIVADRDLAQMRPETRGLLARVNAQYPCAVISGRGLDDVASRLEATGVRHVVGNHGMEPGSRLGEFERAAELGFEEARRRLAGHEGLDFEHKRYSFAVHYRRSRDRDAARRAIDETIASLSVATRVVPGHLVVNVMPHGAPDKGDALDHLRVELACELALFVGDDITDEDVFRHVGDGRVVGVRVGRSDESSATWFVRDQDEVDELLRVLVALREPRVPEGS